MTYQSFAREIAERPQSGRWQELLPELICRQIVHLALDARVRLFRYEQWIPAKWAELHAPDVRSRARSRSSASSSR